MKTKYLPIGSVVLLNGGSKKMMITGYFSQTEDSLVYEYRGCPYPEGVLISEGTALFNSSDIKEVCHVGFQNDESIDFLDKIEIITTKE